MARTRYIKPEFFTDTRVADISVYARFLYVGLWTLMDKQGITEDDPKLIRGHVFPYDDSISTKKVEAMIQELVSIGRLRRVEHDGKKYLYCRTFSKHQWFHGGEQPKYVIPKDALYGNGSTTDSVQVNARANPSVDGNGNGDGERRGDADSNESSTAAPPPVISEFKEIAPLLVARKVSVEVQQGWLDTYPDPPWVISKIKRAVNWEAETGRRKQRFAAFIGRWLAKDWDARRGSANGTINTTPTPLETP